MALAETGDVQGQHGEGAVAAVGPLQDALEKCADQIPPQVYDAIGVVAQALIADRQLIAGRGHLVLQIGIGGAKDQRPLQLLHAAQRFAVDSAAGQARPAAAAGARRRAVEKRASTTAIEPALRGAWRLAADKLTALAAKVGDWPAIWHNIAVLRTWLAETPRAVEALRKYAAQQIPLDDAVEAEGAGPVARPRVRRSRSTW